MLSTCSYCSRADYEKLLNRYTERKKENSRGKINFPQNNAHKKQKWINEKEILAVGYLYPTAPVDGTSIYNAHRNAMDRLV